MESFDVYDEYGKKTGNALARRSELVSGQYRLAINAYICNHNGEFLIQKRAKNKKFLPGLWDIHMGHVKTGETSDHALVREIREEIGLSVDYINVVKQDYFVWHQEKYIINIYFLFTDADLSMLTIEPSEVDDVKYVNHNEMLNIIHSMTRPEEYKLTAANGILYMLSLLK